MDFTYDQIQSVWEKGKIVHGYDSATIRKDRCGAWIIRDKFGLRITVYGWGMDYIRKISGEGNEKLSNLRPLQWENLLSKVEGKIVCKVSSTRDKNIYLR